MVNIVGNLCKLTTIKKDAFEQLFNKMSMCIYDAVLESKISEETITECDIGLGTLVIYHTPTEIKYRFKPSAKFEEGIKNAYLHDDNTLDKTVDKALREKLINTYKDLI